MPQTAPDARRPDWIVLLVALLSFPLFLYGLGNTYLWQDEAQTALLGRSVLKYGVPMVGTGAESLSAHMGKDAGVGGLYLHISWLQAYIAAASFALFGESSWSARVPFAFAGWLCVPLTGWVVRRAGGSRIAARVAALLTATSVPFIVCSRQARYYALTAAAALLVAGTYTLLVERAKARQPIGLISTVFASAGTVLVLSFDVTALGLLAVIALHWTLFVGSRSTPAWRFWATWIVPMIVLISWIGFSLTAPMRHDNAGLMALPNRIRYGVLFYAGQIDIWIIPLPILAMALVGLRSRERPAVILLGFCAAGALAGVLLSPYRFFRYLVPAVPFVFGLAAIALAALAEAGRAGRIAAAAIVVVLAGSTAIHAASGTLLRSIIKRTGGITVRSRPIEARVLLAGLLHELRDPPRGPVAASIDYLNRHARAGDVIVVTYSELPLRFHTRLKVYGGETAQLPEPGEHVRWIWPRNVGRYTAVVPAIEWVEGELKRGSYVAVELGGIDRRWENREDPAEHIFTNPGPPGPHIVLYRASD
jgi:4-amino-4-deoxy-L-arabinose transferase-like glycosyltransferase